MRTMLHDLAKSSNQWLQDVQKGKKRPKTYMKFIRVLDFVLRALTTWTLTYIVLVSEISWYEIPIWKAIMSAVYNRFRSLRSTISSSSSSLIWHHEKGTVQAPMKAPKVQRKLQRNWKPRKTSVISHCLRTVRSGLTFGEVCCSFVLPRLTDALSLFPDIRTDTIYKKNDVLVLFTFAFVMPLIFP